MVFYFQKMSQLQQSAHRRGLAYRCRHCIRSGEAEPYTGERYRVVAHVYKLHIPLDRAPFSCTACLFRSTTLSEFERHLTSYTWHRQRAGVDGDYLHTSQKPYQITVFDLEPLSKGESLRFFMDRSRRGPRSSPSEVEEFFTAFKADLAGDDMSAAPLTTDFEVANLELEAAVSSITSVSPPPEQSPSLPNAAALGSEAAHHIPSPRHEPSPAHSTLSAQVMTEIGEALDLRVVKVRGDYPTVDVLAEADKSLEEDQPKKRVRRESWSSSSSSSSSSSISSNSSQSSDTSDAPNQACITKNLTEALGNLVKEATNLVTESVDKTMTMMAELQKAVEKQARELQLLREVMANKGEGVDMSTQTRHEDLPDPRGGTDRERRNGQGDRSRDRRTRSQERRRRSLERRRRSLERREIRDWKRQTESSGERWDNRRAERNLNK